MGWALQLAQLHCWLPGLLSWSAEATLGQWGPEQLMELEMQMLHASLLAHQSSAASLPVQMGFVRLHIHREVSLAF